jgi:hypothetical protein
MTNIQGTVIPAGKSNAHPNTSTQSPKSVGQIVGQIAGAPSRQPGRIGTAVLLGLMAFAVAVVGLIVVPLALAQLGVLP